jgi:peptide deformylase
MKNKKERREARKDKKDKRLRERLGDLQGLVKTWGDLSLKTRCIETNSFADVTFIWQKMIAVLNSFDKGVGLAANQIGAKYRIIAVDELKTRHPEIMINPKIIEFSEEKETFSEGCLSFPGCSLQIERPSTIVVEYIGTNGGKVKETAKGLRARIIQHEIDHLDGNCLVGEKYFSQMKGE